jgi:hypothetical protein
MKTKINQALTEATDNYSNKKFRGYKMGLFSAYRHSFTKTDKMLALERKLKVSTQDSAMYSLIDHLIDPNATHHHHSFNSYLIDALKTHIPEIDWDCFTPKAIKKYQGIIYRGTSQPLAKIFEQGFRELESSEYIKPYIKPITYSVGISMTKDFECAKTYATDNTRSGKRRYIYKVDYRGEHGYDVLGTIKARGIYCHKFFSPYYHRATWTQEVNVKNVITNVDVIGAWELEKNNQWSWRDNPLYRKNVVLQESSNKVGLTRFSPVA